MTNKLPRLLVLASTYPRWSNDTEPAFVHELSRRLTTQFDVTVLAPHASGSKDEEVLDNVRVVRFRYAPASLECLVHPGGILSNLRRRPWTWLLIPPYLAALLLAMRRESRTRAFDVMHAHWLIPQGLVAAVFKRWSSASQKLVCTSHGGDLFGLQGFPGRLLKQFTLRNCDAVTTVSSAMMNVALSLTETKPLARVIPMGVDLKHRFVPSSVVPRESGLVVFVGRLVEKKGVPVLIDAFKLLIRIKPDSRLRIIGDGPQRGILEKRAAALGLSQQVEFIGALPSETLPGHLQQATVLAMPSVETRDGDQEGFGLVQIEAMGCMCPVVSSDLPAIRDVVRHDETGLLVPTGNAELLASSLQRVLDDPQLGHRLATGAREYALRHFDWNTIAGRYIELLNDVRLSTSSKTS